MVTQQQIEMANFFSHIADSIRKGAGRPDLCPVCPYWKNEGCRFTISAGYRKYYPDKRKEEPCQLIYTLVETLADAHLLEAPTP